MNLPNKLSLTRLIMVPFMMLAYFQTWIPYGEIIAVVIFVVAAFTDMLDGHIARSRGLVTNLGKLLDPIADKLLCAGAVLVLVIDGILPHPWGMIAFFIMIFRDFSIGGLRQISAAAGYVLAADKWGKIKAIVLDISIAVLFVYAYFVNAGSAETLAGEVFMWVGFALFAIATVLTITSGVNYFVKNKSVFKEVQ